MNDNIAHEDATPIQLAGSQDPIGALLSRAMLHLRADRAPYREDQKFYVRTDNAMGGTFAQVWFQTRGCTWDRRGACTMCNYGHAAEVEPEQMVSYVQQALDTIDDDLAELYVSPSGSLLDEREVPVQARRLILERIRDYPVDRFSFETRSETVTEEAVAELVEYLPGKDIAVGFGLESADPKVLQFCLNKPGQPVEFTRAAALLHDSGIRVYANIALGAPFLSPKEAIADAVATVTWSLQHGADLAILFPLHVKSHTLLHWLHMNDRYEPPSLWALVDVLESLDADLLTNVTISWYRSDYGDEQSIIASPLTCQACESDVFKALDAFRANASANAVQNLSLLECECRATWRASVLKSGNEPLPARIANNYEAIAVGLGLGEWWIEHADDVLNELRHM